MGARIASILRKAEMQNIDFSDISNAANLLTESAEWDLIKALGEFPDLVNRAAENLDPSVMTSYLYDVSKLFSKFYQQCPILTAENSELVKARLYLASCTLTVLKNAMHLVLVPYLEKM